MTKIDTLIAAARALCASCKEMDRYPYGEVAELEDALKDLELSYDHMPASKAVEVNAKRGMESGFSTIALAGRTIQ